MRHHRALRALTCAIQTLESRRLLSSAPLDEHDLANSCDGPALDAAFARNGADHDLGWYKPARTVTLERAGGDADPTFTTNAAGLPLLTSRSDGVGMKVFLDFDGNGTNLPFGIDSDDATFNAAEQLAIYDTWRDMISYFSQFNVNITTVQPATGGTLFAWHLTSKSISGGYAFVNSLTNSAPSGFNQATDAVGRHSGIAHEVGHIMGLSHQGEWDKLGVNVTEYTEGFGARDISIMGVDYGTNVRTWIYGRTSSGASALQNDIAVLAAKAASVVGGDGYRPDDFGSTLATAYVVPSTVQQVSAFLERSVDVDLFQISPSSAGPWQIDATPTYESSASPKIELLDSLGNVIASRDDADQRNQRNNDVEFTIHLEPGTYYVRVSSSGDYSETGEYLLTAGPLMNGFVSTDISTTIDRGGTASYDPATGILTQLGTGSDIFGTADQFRFTHDTIVGDGSVTARVLSIDNTDPSAKAGIMFRASTLNTSAFVMMSIKPGGQIELINRGTSSASATTVASITPGGVPKWLKLLRTGTSFVGSWSEDGITWNTLGSTTNVMPSTALLGMATTSHNTRKAAYAQFDQLTFTGALGEAAPTYNALTPPTDLTSTPAVGPNTSVVLNWTDTTGETGYAIERSVDGVTFVRLGGSVAANVTTYTDALTFGSMRWWYRVVALSSSTSSAPSAVTSVVNKPSAPTIPATAYAVPAISASNGTAIYLNWADVQGDIGYKVERSIDGTTFTQIGTTSTNLNAFNDTTALANTGYLYRITPLTNVGDAVAPALTFEAGTRWTSSAFKTVARTSTSITLNWTDFASETAYRIERTTNGVTGWATVTTLPANQTTWANTSLTQLTEYYYRVVADLPLSEIISSAIGFAATLPTTPLPSGWNDADIGTVGGWGIGGTTNGGTTFKVIGGGTQIGSTTDSLHFQYKPLNGDGSITVRVDSQKSNDIDDNAEAGIMIRESLAANARYAYINVEPGRNGRTDLEYRSTTGGSVSNVSGTATRSPIWMRLTRAGSSFTAEYSSNGTTWTLIGTQTISMAVPVYIGMAVGAIESNLLSFANYSSVAITGDTTANQKPFLLSPAFATTSPVTGTNTALNVVGGDDAGETALTYTWTAPVIPAGRPSPTFNATNGTNAGKNITATFGGSGVYTLRVTITDAGGLTTTSDVSITVVATLTSFVITPATPTIAPGATQSFSASARDQFGGTMALPSFSWSASGGSITAAGDYTAPANAGPVTITATSGAASGSTTATVNLVNQSPAFSFETSPHSISIALNGDVSASLSPSDFVLTNTTTSQVIAASDLTVSWNAGTSTATIAYAPGVLPDGLYTLAVAAADVSLASGQSLNAPISYGFAFQLGDMTADNAVNFDDLLILAQNYGLTGRTYSQGDLNYDGAVNFDDLLILAQRYGTTLVLSAPTPTTTTAKRRSGFGDQRVV